MIRSLLVVAIFITGCSKLESTQSVEPMSSSFFTPGDGSTRPATDRMSADCVTNSEFDTCLYLKNPVAQEKTVLGLGELNGARKFGVKLRGLNTSGFLQNDRISVLTLGTPRYSFRDRGGLKRSWSSSDSHVEQLSAYYWANLASEYIEKHLGSDRYPAGLLRIYVDDAFSGFSAASSSIHLERKPGVVPKALSGEVVVALMGQSFAARLSEGKVFDRASKQHNSCALSPRGCCKTDLGCAQALASSFGDYLAGIMFPEDARLGETVAGSTLGQNVCGFRRNLSALGALTRAEIYSACPEIGLAVAMGSWYASVWWRLRVQVAAQDTLDGADDIDKLFFDHARAWHGDSTYADAKSEALRLAAAYKNGKYLAQVTAALAAI